MNNVKLLSMLPAPRTCHLAAVGCCINYRLLFFILKVCAHGHRAKIDLKSESPCLSGVAPNLNQTVWIGSADKI